MNPTVERDKKQNEVMAENMLKQAAEAAMDEMLDELPTQEEDITFSARHEENMRKLFESAAPKKKGVLRPKRIMVLVAALVVLGGAVSTVGRNPKIMQFFMETTETNTEIRYKEGENTGDTYVTDDVKLGYIPDGMQLVKSTRGDFGTSLTFQKEEKQFVVRFSKIKHKENWDTEHGDIEKIRIHNMDGYLQKKGNMECVYWYAEDFVYSIYGNLGKDEILKIAENIQ